MLKWIAALSMCIDHIAAVVLKGYFNQNLERIPAEQWQIWETAYDLMRAVGRLAFPLFAFLLVEGFFHTKDHKRYGLRLFAAAVLSELPYDLAIYGQAFCLKRQNTVFTLLIGYLVLNLIHQLRLTGDAQTGRMGAVWKMSRELLAVAAGCLLACVCRVDYTWHGVLLIAVFYFFYGYQRAAAVGGFCVFAGSPWSLPSFLLLPFYNGRRKRALRGFYLFYPLHLLVLSGILRLWVR